MRIRKSIPTLMFVVLITVSAVAQDPPAKPDSVDKYRRCDLQVRMFEGYCFPSMIDLIANPELFDGKKIMVAGYVHFAFEGDAIYFHKDDFLYGIVRNALWLEVSSNDRAEKFADCQDSYAWVRGIFKAGIGGHFSMASGELHDIAKCSVIDNRRE